MLVTLVAEEIEQLQTFVGKGPYAAQKVINAPCDESQGFEVSRNTRNARAIGQAKIQIANRTAVYRDSLNRPPASAPSSINLESLVRGIAAPATAGQTNRLGDRLPLR